MFLLLATVLSAAPLGAKVHSAPPARMTLQLRVDFGGMLMSSWYVPQTRTHIDAAIGNARGMLRGDEVLDGNSVLLAMPVVGPWMLAGHSPNNGELAMLVGTGVLQLAGLAMATLSLTAAPEARPSGGPVLSFSPIAAGHLGFSVKLANF